MGYDHLKKAFTVRVLQIKDTFLFLSFIRNLLEKSSILMQSVAKVFLTSRESSILN
jgi:hypothetical protein